MVNGTAALRLPKMGLTVAMYTECQAKTTLRNFSHVLIRSSVGHATTRREFIDPKEFGRAFVAMALERHSVDGNETVLLGDDMYKKLAAMVEEFSNHFTLHKMFTLDT